MKPRNVFALFCLLIISVDSIEAGIFKSGRRNDLAMLLAGGILTILFQEGAGLVRQNVEHGTGGAYMGHGMHYPMVHPYGPYPELGHPMAGFHFPMHGASYGGMMGGYGHHMPLHGMGSHVPDMGHRFPYGGLPMPMGRGYPLMMHGLNMPMGHAFNIGNGFRNHRQLKNNNYDSSYRPSPNDEEDFRQIFKKLESQDEPYNGHREAKFDDSSLGVQYSGATHQTD